MNEIRQALATVGAVLAQGDRMDRLSRAVTVAALIGLVVFGGRSVRPMLLLLAGAVLAGVIQLWFAIRVAIDAALFHRLSRAAGEPDWDALDNGLTRFGLMPRSKAGRPPEARIAGALRLLRWQGAALMVQLACVAITALFGLAQ